MGDFLIHRLIHTAFVLLSVIFISFIITELPPGDFLTDLRGRLSVQGVDPAVIDNQVLLAKQRYGLDDVWYIRFLNWFTALLQGDLGYSMGFNKPNSEVIGDRLALTMGISILSLLLTFVIAIPVGMISAIKQYSIWDYSFTFIAFLGVSTPAFILALIAMFLSVTVFGWAGTASLFSPEYVFAPWSLAKIMDFLSHVWIVVVLVGLAGTAETIRVVRAKMLDSLSEPYIDTARMKGLSSREIYIKHALRVAINPVVSGIGLRFPQIISGSTIVEMVLVLPTIGPVLLLALQNQDIYLASTILLLLTIALVIGNFFSDLALAWLDPRIRY